MPLCSGSYSTCAFQVDLQLSAFVTLSVHLVAWSWITQGSGEAKPEDSF